MNRSFHRSFPPNRQRGVVLFVGLIMLLLLTLIGIAAMQVTVLQERMAGNFYVQHLGFENGEAVLAAGRDTAHSSPATYGFDCSVPPYPCLVLGSGDTLPWGTWISSEPTIPQTQIVMLYSSSDANAAVPPPRLRTHYYSVAAVGGDATGDAKTALQGIYIF